MQEKEDAPCVKKKVIRMIHMELKCKDTHRQMDRYGHDLCERHAAEAESISVIR